MNPHDSSNHNHDKHPMNESFGLPYTDMLWSVTKKVAEHYNIDPKKVILMIFRGFIAKNYASHYEEFTGLGFTQVKNPNTGVADSKWSFSFEGVDATGKQTLVRTLNDYFHYVYKLYTMELEANGANVYAPIKSLDPTSDDLQNGPGLARISKRFNIPDYELESGKEIAEILKAGGYDPELLQIKFALNRKEVQNKINIDDKIAGNLLKKFPDTNTLGHNKINYRDQENILIFDRWVDSGAMYKLSKCFYSKLQEDITFMEFMNQYGDITSQLEESILSPEWNLLKIFNDQLNLEHNILGLVRPNVKFLCISNPEDIRERILNRAVESGIHPDELDSHEKDIKFLTFTQDIYKVIYQNPKKFFSGNIFTVGHKNFKIINTSELNQEQCLEHIIIKILDCFCQKEINNLQHNRDIGWSISESMMMGAGAVGASNNSK